jgi:hypothetical protein
MIPVGGLVGAISTTEVTIRTYGAPSTNIYGEVTASATDAARDVVVHPATTALLDRMPEADRLRDTIAVYTTDALRTVSTTRPPLVYYQSTWYEVVQSEDYGTLGGIYITLAQRLETQPGAPS